MPREDWVEAAQAEADGRDAIKDLLATVLDIATDSGVWNWGDGFGGAVHEWLNDLAADRGVLPVSVQRYRIQPAIADRIAKRDGWCCHYCGIKLFGHVETFGPASVDHVLPTSRGGTNALSNLRLACVPCNSSKGARTPQEWHNSPTGALTEWHEPSIVPKKE